MANHSETEKQDSKGKTTRRRLIGESGKLALGLSTIGSVITQQAAAQPVPEAPVKPAPMNPGVSPIDRAFARIAEGPVHYRYMDGRGISPDLPLVLCHASPGSSERLVALIPGLSNNRLVVAPDTLGYGDSPPPANDYPDIAYFADATVRVLKSMGIEQVDFYGTHTGAVIGADLAVRYPNLIRKLAVDGLPLFTDDFKKDAVKNYAPPMTPDSDGDYLAWAWGKTEGTGMSAEQRHANTMLLLKALETYHLGYRAAIGYDVHSLLPKITQPSLAMAIERDPMSAYLDDVAAGLRHSEKTLIETEAGTPGKLAALQRFFGIS
ncbi:MAG: alpha/beta fold hydrolase [Lysobacterales bacterium]